MIAWTDAASGGRKRLISRFRSGKSSGTPASTARSASMAFPTAAGGIALLMPWSCSRWVAQTAFPSWILSSAAAPSSPASARKPASRRTPSQSPRSSRPRASAMVLPTTLAQSRPASA